MTIFRHKSSHRREGLGFITRLFRDRREIYLPLLPNPDVSSPFSLESATTFRSGIKLSINSIITRVTSRCRGLRSTGRQRSILLVVSLHSHGKIFPEIPLLKVLSILPSIS